MVDAVLALPEDTRLMILAPVVRDRKGEFTELFEDMQARGYVRFRVGGDGEPGQVVEAEALPKLKKNEKHDIDVVIDRLKSKPDVKQRLAESFEASLRIADGRAIALEMDSGVEHLFSSKFGCPVCSYSLPELEPRLFSFNSPVGACPACDGLGPVSYTHLDVYKRQVEEGHAVPFGFFLAFAAVLVLPLPAGGDGDVADGRAAGCIAHFGILAEVADEDDFVDRGHGLLP